MLELMALDTTPSIYLGRPCYHGLHKQTPCSPIFWTHGRYSLPVLDSMARALDTVGAETHPEQIVLIGYSGGGALAMLLAERVPKVSAVVTIAGNLDPDRWARHHDYTPLSTSLNPARRKPLPSRVYQLHIAAEDDSVVPPEMVLEAVTRQRAPDVRVVPGIDHVCCWHALWPSLLTALSARLESEPGGH
jgi:pimeloyl-ACP methyl ester carboxylesterase